MDTEVSETHIHWVKPVLPTTLGDIESLSIPGTDKIFAGPDSTWVFPGPLDFKKLRNALAQTLRDYPHAAGRLSYNPKTREWRIKLTNEGVPITVGTTDLPYAPDEWFQNNERHPDLIDPLPMSFHPLELGDEPLLRFKLTTWEKTGDTSLSIAWCHILGDASTLMRVMHAFSNYYQDLRPIMIPTFEKYLNPGPTIERQFVYNTLAQVPHLGVDYGAKKFYEMYSEMQSTTSRVDIKLTLADITAILDLTKSTSDGKRISTMDSIVAYLITVLNRTEDVLLA